MTIPIVPVVVPFQGLPLRILITELVKSTKGLTMETIGIRVIEGLGYRVLGF